MDRQSAHGGGCWVSPRHRGDKSAARRIDVISSTEMFDVAACGAKVLQARYVEYPAVLVSSCMSARPSSMRMAPS